MDLSKLNNLNLLDMKEKEMTIVNGGSTNVLPLPPIYCPFPGGDKKKPWDFRY